MADLDSALDVALRLHDPKWSPPDTSEFMRRARAELVDIEPLGPEDDEADEAAFDGDAAAVHRPSGTAVSVVNEATATQVTGDHPTG